MTEEIRQTQEKLEDQIQLKNKEIEADISALKDKTVETHFKLEEASRERKEVKTEVTEEISKSKKELEAQLLLQKEDMKEDSSLLKKTAEEIHNKLEEATTEREELKSDMVKEIEKHDKLKEQLQLQSEETGKILNRLEEASVESMHQLEDLKSQLVKQRELEKASDDLLRRVQLGNIFCLYDYLINFSLHIRQVGDHLQMRILPIYYASTCNFFQSLVRYFQFIFSTALACVKNKSPRVANSNHFVSISPFISDASTTLPLAVNKGDLKTAYEELLWHYMIIFFQKPPLKLKQKPKVLRNPPNVCS